MKIAALLMLLTLASCSGLDENDPKTYGVLDHTWPEWVCVVGSPTTSYCP